MAEVTLDHLTKEYGGIVAVHEMALDIEDGEFITMVGPSGCGKSTTLEMVAGLTRPTEGRIYIDDEDVTDRAPKDRGIAMVFQNIALFPHMDVYDNVSYGLRLRGYDADEIDDRVDEAMEILQLEGLLDRMPSELSGGQRQRVAIGRAIVRDPSVFLLDEPLANLDAKLRIHMRTELQRIQRELDVTTIYVTHDQAEAMTMSDRVAVINDGELQQFAPPLDCYNQPNNRFVAGFIGSPGMNFFDCVARSDVIECAGFEIDLAADVDGVAPGDRVTLGIRPEDVYPASRVATNVTPEMTTEAMTGVALGVEPSREIEAMVDVIEPMGDETFVYLDVHTAENAESADETETLLMKADPDADIEEGESIRVVFDRSKIHLFDGETENALVHTLSADQEPVESQ